MDSKRRLGRWIGVAEEIGSSMTYYILPKSGKPIARSTVYPVTSDDLLAEEVKAMTKEFDDKIASVCGDSLTDHEFDAIYPGAPQIPDDIFDDDVDVEFEDETLRRPDADEIPTSDAYDQYLTANVLIDRNGITERGVVTSRQRDDDGNGIGKANSNPLLDTREYSVEFPDGSIDYLTANNIAESMYSMVDSEGREHMLLDEIIDHKFDGVALKKDDSIIPGTNKLRRTTKGTKRYVVI
jgi:hypothetical protein